MSRTAGSEADGGGIARKIERDEDSGPLAIVERVDAQQTNAEQARNVPVEHIGALTADELEEVTSISDPAARGLSSGAFDKGGVDWSVLRKPISLPPPLPQRAIAEEPPRPALKAFYDKLPQASERAEIQIEDLSLDFTNPFVGSSLLPPPPKKRPWLKPVVFTAAAGLLVGAGYIGALWNGPASQPTAAVGEAPISEPEPQLTAAEPATPAALPSAEPAAQPQPGAPADAQPVVVAAQPLTALPQPQTTSQPAVLAVQPTVASAQSNAVLPAQPKVASPAAPAAPAATSRPRARPVPAAPKPELATSAPATPSTAPAPVSASPEPPAAGATLSRAQVQIGLESSRSALQACAAGGHGRTMANVTISGAGRVTYASIEGAFAGTPQGSCMARALRAAQFPPFTSAQLTVRYPFAF